MIHEIENLLRQLIGQFMLTKLGTDWVSEASPRRSRRGEIGKSKRKSDLNILHSFDFIHLGDFLFQEVPCKGQGGTL